MKITAQHQKKFPRPRRLIAIGLFAIAVMIGACTEDPVSSQRPEVTNTDEQFRLTYTGVENKDTIMIYYWRMGGTTANIDQSATIKGGAGTIVVSDSSQFVVYSTDLITNGSYTTLTGKPGFWRIRIDLDSFSGDIDFLAVRK